MARMRRFALPVCLLLCAFLAAPAAAAAGSVCLQELINFNMSPFSPTSLADPNDGTDRLFVGLQNGDINIYKKSTGDSIGTFMHVPNVLPDMQLPGLNNLVFHPQYKTNGKFYVGYPCTTTDCPQACPADPRYCGTGLGCTNGTAPKICAGDHVYVIGQYQVSANDPNTANPTEAVRVLHQTFPNREHTVGSALFAPDGTFIMSLGDGGDPTRSQSGLSLLGKVARVDVNQNPQKWPEGNWAIPGNNPNIPGQFGEAYAIGFQNPARCSWDGANGGLGLVCGDRGQQVEEIDIVTAGGNYGWPYYEGTQRQTATPGNPPAGLKTPALTYTHDVGSGVVGGVVYPGALAPCLAGDYVYADTSGGLFVAKANAGTLTSQALSPVCAGGNPCPPLGLINTVTVDSANEIYVLAASGVYKVADPTTCNMQCTANGEVSTGASPSPSPSGNTSPAPATTAPATTGGQNQTTSPTASATPSVTQATTRPLQTDPATTTPQAVTTVTSGTLLTTAPVVQQSSSAASVSFAFLLALASFCVALCLTL